MKKLMFSPGKMLKLKLTWLTNPTNGFGPTESDSIFYNDVIFYDDGNGNKEIDIIFKLLIEEKSHFIIGTLFNCEFKINYSFSKGFEIFIAEPGNKVIDINTYSVSVTGCDINAFPNILCHKVLDFIKSL